MDKSKLWKEIEVCENINEFVKKYQEGVEEREKGYAKHTRCDDNYFHAQCADVMEPIRATSKSRNRSFTENRLAYAFANSHFEYENIGKIVEFQIPLKYRNDIDNKGIGKIDLISRKDKNIYLIELKKHGSTESLKRAVIEIFLYSTIVSNHRDKFYADLGLPDDTIVYPTVLIPNNRMSKVKKDNINEVLFGKLNNWLVDNTFGKIKFFEYSAEITSEIDISPVKERRGYVKITFPEERNVKENIEIKEFQCYLTH